MARVGRLYSRMAVERAGTVSSHLARGRHIPSSYPQWCPRVEAGDVATREWGWKETAQTHVGPGANEETGCGVPTDAAACCGDIIISAWNTVETGRDGVPSGCTMRTAAHNNGGGDYRQVAKGQ